jgi:lauroyl/myristoyl acyltransferase
VFTLREGRSRYRVVVRPSITVARSADRQRDVAEAVQRLADEVERVVRSRPHQWFCFAKIWP